METLPAPPRRKVGRPLSFDRDAALSQAMLLFWRHGYEATAISDLTAAMGVTPPSLYAAFGDKKRLFLEAVALYLSGDSRPQSIIDRASDARTAALTLMAGAAQAYTGTDTPPGCMLATSAISVSAAAADVQAALSDIRNGVEAHLRARIEADIAAGALPPDTDTDAEALAAHTTAVIQGLSTLARDGAPRKKLERVVAMAMRAWPEV
ncbi:MAG: TetR/AcrR family transcriptional regulator [Brevundimonas sp.]|nr:MAG: TetR/AcrR family transcriptional regulator [Brevundimonas sp.]